ncbi:hypothetical protein QUF75_09760 [Desulfococcaceae bacterium HSG7]|nr:hypothetical protein [Desulfococcaceae bacterium HSG7]
MHRKQFTALLTSPLVLLIADELSFPKVLYHLEIVDHAHSVLRSVTFVQLLQSRAWEVNTSIGTILPS